MIQSKKTDELIEIWLSPKKVSDLDRWAEHNGVTRSEAIHRLLNSALAAFRAATRLKLINRTGTRRKLKQNRKKHVDER
jgi:hypothetical protein